MKKKIFIFVMFLLVFTVLTGCIQKQELQVEEKKDDEQQGNKDVVQDEKKMEDEDIEREEEKQEKNILEEVDELGRKIYRNEEYGFEFKYSKNYPFNDRTSMFKETDNFPWYSRPSFLLKDIQIKDYEVNSKTYINFRILNTVDEGRIKASGGWESIERIEDEKIGSNNYQVFRKSAGQGIKVIIKDEKSFAFSGYLEDVEFNEMLETFKFIK